MEHLKQLSKAYTAVVADALDQLDFRDQALDPAVRPLWPGARLAGRALPVVVEVTEVFFDPPYERQIQVLETIEPGDVVLIAVDPASRAAMWGELFSCAARGAGAAGVVTDGLVRDVRQIVELAFPVFARGCSPLDTRGRAEVVSLCTEARCGGVLARRGDFVLADDDGVVIVPEAVIQDLVALVHDKVGKEKSGREDLLAGVGVREVWERYGIF